MCFKWIQIKKNSEMCTLHCNEVYIYISMTLHFYATSCYDVLLPLVSTRTLNCSSGLDLMKGYSSALQLLSVVVCIALIWQLSLYP